MPLETSVRPPDVRAEWLRRPDLVRRISAVTAKLTLLQAPAGFGKTTLVSQWRAASGGARFAWATLDFDDNSPGRLWSKVISAVRRACPEFDTDPPLTLLPGQERILLTALVTRLAALRGPVVLVLDDYQVISQHRCHTQVEVLLRDLPRPLRVVLATRTRPALRLARLRAAGDVADIGMRELRFGRAEVSALVSEVAGVMLADFDLDALVARTEGWPAGVYLAALSLRGHPSPHAFIDEFSGDNRFIADFLAEEVLGRQPPDVREFLLRTSILGRFTAPLCEAVTGRPGAAQLIDRLERENLFLVAEDEHRVWYRYHRLFGQMLQGRLARAEPGLVPVLHGRASAWHRESGSTGEAIAHAMSAGDRFAVTGLIAARWYDLAQTGRAATVQNWIRSLGDATVAGDPVAAHCAAWVAALSGDVAAVRRWLPVIEAGAGDGTLPDGMRSLASSAALLRATFGFDGLRAMNESGVAGAEMEGDPASPWYAYARAVLGFGLHLAGDPLATPTLDQALAAEASRPLTRLVALSVASLRAADDDRLEQARELTREACTIVNGGGFSRLGPSSFVLAALGTVHWRQGDLEEARAEFEYAMYRCRRWIPLAPWPGVEIRLRLADVLLAMDDRPAAVSVLAGARDVLAIWPDGTEALLGRLARLERRLAVASPRQGPAEPLTEREKAVLRLLRKPLSVSEIARQLFVSGNTVKTHRRAIYRKLGVSTREEAIERAREFGVLR